MEVVFAIGSYWGDEDSDSGELFGIETVVLDCVGDWGLGCVVVVYVYWLNVKYVLGCAGVQQCKPENCRSWPGIVGGPRPSVGD